MQTAVVYRKPDRSLDGRSIPFDTLQIEVSLTRKGGKAVARHGTPFVCDAVGMCSCPIVPGMRSPPVPH